MDNEAGPSTPTFHRRKWTTAYDTYSDGVTFKEELNFEYDNESSQSDSDSDSNSGTPSVFNLASNCSSDKEGEKTIQLKKRLKKGTWRKRIYSSLHLWRIRSMDLLFLRSSSNQIENKTEMAAFRQLHQIETEQEDIFDFAIVVRNEYCTNQEDMSYADNITNEVLEETTEILRRADVGVQFPTPPPMQNELCARADFSAQFPTPPPVQNASVTNRRNLVDNPSLPTQNVISLRAPIPLPPPLLSLKNGRVFTPMLPPLIPFKHEGTSNPMPPPLLPLQCRSTPAAMSAPERTPRKNRSSASIPGGVSPHQAHTSRENRFPLNIPRGIPLRIPPPAHSTRENRFSGNFNIPGRVPPQAHSQRDNRFRAMVPPRAPAQTYTPRENRFPAHVPPVIPAAQGYPPRDYLFPGNIPPGVPTQAYPQRDYAFPGNILPAIQAPSPRDNRCLLNIPAVFPAIKSEFPSRANSPIRPPSVQLLFEQNGLPPSIQNDDPRYINDVPRPITLPPLTRITPELYPICDRIARRQRLFEAQMAANE